MKFIDTKKNIEIEYSNDTELICIIIDAYELRDPNEDINKGDIKLGIQFDDLINEMRESNKKLKPYFDLLKDDQKVQKDVEAEFLNLKRILSEIDNVADKIKESVYKPS